MSGAALPSFAEFFKSVHGYEPFPWQTRLAARVLDEGWPDLLDLPTGTGKTSALDVALYTLAAAPERLPRRTLLVVDRRIVVDQGADHAHRLRRQLMQAEAHGPAAVIATRLRALWGAQANDAPFAIATMRGGMPRDNDWAKRPDVPVLGVSTVDQVGSRLLFRGYGISAKSASIHAGLLGNDTLILLDEVHLANAFAETLRVVQERYRRGPERLGLPDRFAVVRMSATPQQRAGGTKLTLAEDDKAHPVLRQRLQAKKPAQLVQLDVRGDNEAGKRAALAARAVEAALELQRGGAKVVGLVVNRVDTAREAWSLLGKHEGTRRLLVTGRMRPIDRDHLVRAKLLSWAGAGRRRADDQPAILVATQCIEAGADLDFDALVTECASLDALRQRFGRLDRRGEVTRERGQAPAVILCRRDQASAREPDAVYGKALAATWTWLQAQAKREIVGFGIDELPAVDDPEVLKPMLASVAEPPVLLPAHLDAWAHTSPVLTPSPDPDPALWLHGPERAPADVQVVWRTDLLDGDGGGRLTRELTEELERVRPSSLEAMTLPIHAVRAWLAEAPDARGIADVLEEEAEEEARRDDSAARGRPFLRIRRGGDPEWTTLAAKPRDRDASNELRPGDLVVVPTSYGGINADGTFDPAVTEPATDVADLAQLRGRGKATLRISAEALRLWQLDDAVRAAAPKEQPEGAGDAGDERESAAEQRDRVTSWAKTWPTEAPAGFPGTPREWSAARDAFSELKVRSLASSLGRLVLVQAVPRDALRGGDPDVPDLVSDVVTEDDDSSFRAAEVPLRAHSEHVQRWARQFATALGFPKKLASDLALAAWLHDVGKADARFQRMLLGGDEVQASMLGEPLAKSGLSPGNAEARRLAQRRAGYPTGYRHEILSLAMIERSEAALETADDRELVLHLVASHHGWCRPHAPALDHPDDLPVQLTHGEVTLQASTRHRKALASSGVAQRFWQLTEKYGWWGLAWLEAVLRLADHRASEQEESQ